MGLLLAVLFSRGVTPAQGASHARPPDVSLYDEPVRLVDDTGTQLELSSFQGRQVLLTMFYTRCRSACPVTVRKLRQIEQAFADRGRPIDIVLVSYDSDFDHPKVLARYRDREKLPPGWRLLCGQPLQVERLAQHIGLWRYLDMGDHIFHSYRIVLLDEAGVVRKALDSDHNNVSSLFEGAGNDVEPAGARP